MMMNKEVILFTMDGCPYCTEFKDRLNNMGISFIEKNITNENDEKEFNELVSVICKNLDVKDWDLLPIAIVENQIILPEKSFMTIEEGSKIVKHLIDS